MILYFANRKMNILGQASTSLPKGFIIVEDLKTEEVETGVATFECKLHFEKSNQNQVEDFTEVGNYILRSNGDENEFYTIIESEIDTKRQEVYVYAEDAGLDLLNEVVGEYEAAEAYPISHYINKFAYDSGFEIGINEVETLTRKLSWDSESTATERIASVAAQFDGCEISYSFEIRNLKIVKKYINIHENRGRNTQIQLRLNKEVDRILTSKSIVNVATALICEGGTPDDKDEPITLAGYEYDDGDFFVYGKKLFSREALEKWGRYVWADEPNKILGDNGHIVKRFSYDTLSQETLCKKAISELKKLRKVEINFEADIKKFPENVKIGDRVNIIDDLGELYLSSRIIELKTSIVDDERTATIGEHKIKTSGISQKVSDLAEQFAKNTVSVKRAQTIAKSAQVSAEEAKTQAEEALTEAGNAQTVANEAKTTAEGAVASAQTAETKANEAKAAVEKVETSVTELETTIESAQQAADNAQQAAATATAKAEEAKTAAETAENKANEADEKAETAKTQAETAIANAETATNTANDAKSQAETASETAAAAKADAEQAQKDIDAWADDLETYKQTVSAEYTRKTELTETTASLQAQITANANELNVVHSEITTIDETANNAKEQAENAQNTANLAQQQANTATANAQAAQSAADEAKTAADNAQAEADNAKAAAEAAQSVADKAETDLENAKADLANVSSRVDATEEEIAAAQQAVATAQSAADKAKQDAADATTKAENAQSVANNAKTAADNAQTAADEAKAAADKAQEDVNNLSVRVTTAETNITKNSEAIALRATKEEVTRTLGGYYTKAETDAALTVKSNEISSNVKSQIEEIAIGGRNLVAVSKIEAGRNVITTQNFELRDAWATVFISAHNLASILLPSTEYTIHYDLELIERTTVPTAFDMRAGFLIYKEGTWIDVGTYGFSESAEVGAKVAVKHTFTTPAAWNGEQLICYSRRWTTEGAEPVGFDAFRVTNFKIEKGNKATDWTPAPEDLSAATEAVSDNADDALTRLEAAETQIKQLADNISMLVQKGDKSSQMVFDETSSTWSFDTGEIDENIAKHSEDIEELKSGATEANANAEKLKDRLDKFEEHISITTYEDEPCLLLFENDSNYKQYITNTRRIITETIDGVETVKSIVNIDEETQNKVIAKESAQIGGFSWKKRDTNRIGLVWEGEIE